MIEALLARTSLPDLHPALVHVPLVLAAAALLFDVWGLAARTSRGFTRAIVALWVLAGLGAGAAYWSGAQAGAAAARGDAPLAAALAAHQEAAFAALVALLAAAALRALAAWGDDSRPLRLLAGIAGPIAIGLVGVASDSGSALVYRHAVAVAPAAAATAGAEAACELPAGGGGLLLPVAGRAELALAQVAGARVEARLDLAGFRGESWLARRSADGAAELRLRVGPDGAVTLLLLRDGREQRLAEAVRAPGLRSLSLALAPAGESTRGWVDGIGLDAGEALPLDGPAALVLEGSGQVLILGLGPAPEPQPDPMLPARDAAGPRP